MHSFLHNLEPFDLTSDIFKTNVIIREHNLKVFVQPSNCNTVKCSFFHHITSV